MNKSYFDLKTRRTGRSLRVAEDKLGLSNTIIEKDLWLCWLLEELFTLPLKMAFRGVMKKQSFITPHRKSTKN